MPRVDGAQWPGLPQQTSSMQAHPTCRMGSASCMLTAAPGSSQARFVSWFCRWIRTARPSSQRPAAASGCAQTLQCRHLCRKASIAHPARYKFEPQVDSACLCMWQPQHNAGIETRGKNCNTCFVKIQCCCFQLTTVQLPSGTAQADTPPSSGCLCKSKRGAPKSRHGCHARSNSRSGTMP